MNHKSNNNQFNLIINTAFLGDVILNLPMVYKLKQVQPKNKIIFVVKKGLGSFLQNFNFIDIIEEVEKKNSRSYQNLIISLNKKSIDNIFCIHRSFRSFIFTLKLNPNNRIGFKLWFNHFFYKHREIYNKNLPEPLRLMKLLSFVSNDFDFSNLNISDLSFMKTSIPNNLLFKPNLNTEIYSNRLKNILDTKKLRLSKVAIIAPGSVWKTKQWTVSGFTDIAKHLESRNYKVLILGTKNELHLGNKISNSSNSLNLCGKTNLSDCLFLIKSSKIFIGNDSGLTHMAGLFQIPSIAIFGPTHLSLGYRPWNNNAKVVSLNLECSPCGKHGANVCPIKTHACMKDLKSDLVIKTLKNNFNI